MNSIPMKIVLAEDNINDQLLFKEALTFIPISTQLTISDNGKILMNLLNHTIQDLPDIVFLDINMPFYTGLDCLIKMKNNKLLKGIPCVIFSTSDDLQTVKKASEAGADMFILKPEKFANWIKIIQQVLNIDWKDYVPTTGNLFLITDKYL